MEGMRDPCHRCHGELPQSAAGDPQSEENALLFCPRCGAPQIRLPEHMRTDEPGADGTRTTGASPPPRPLASGGVAGSVDWRAAVSSIALVAGIDAVLMAFGVISTAASFLGILWTVSGAIVALGLYARQRPRASVDARVGVRVGLATGVLMIAALGIVLASSEVVMRFGTHSMAAKDAMETQQLATFEAQMTELMQAQNESQEMQRKYHGFMRSPEFRAGMELGGLAFLGGIVLLLSAGFGAVAGMLRASQSPRPGLRRGD